MTNDLAVNLTLEAAQSASSFFTLFSQVNGQLWPNVATLLSPDLLSAQNGHRAPQISSQCYIQGNPEANSHSFVPLPNFTKCLLRATSNHPNATHSSKTNSREQHHTGFQFQAAMRCQEDITFLDDPNWDQIGSQHSRQLRNAECKCCSDGQMVYFLPHCFLCARHGLRWCEQLQFAFGIMASLLKNLFAVFPGFQR